jgi:O-antigen ligase
LFGHGIGASLIGNVEGLDDDVFIMQIFAQYGLLGGIAFIGLFLAAAVTFWTTFNRAEDSNSILLALAFSLIVLLGLSMLHSGVIQRKAIFTVLLWALAIIYGSSRRGIR